MSSAIPDPVAGAEAEATAPGSGLDPYGLIAYRDGVLHVEGVRTDWIADAVGSPVYVYALSAMGEAYGAIRRALNDGVTGGRDIGIHYAVKANSNLAVMSHLRALGAGADIVSGGEMERALVAGFDPGKIIFSGVGKTKAEIEQALSNGVGQFNVESPQELGAIAAVAAETGVTAPVTLRVNPDVDAKTHWKISTGRKFDKFGIQTRHIVSLARSAAENPAIAFRGLAVHIGSQISGAAPFDAAFETVARLVREIRETGVDVTHVDLGGGMGIRYKDEQPLDLMGWAAAIERHIAPLKVHIAIEPGRYIAGPAGILLTRVLYTKDMGGRHLVVADAAMNDLIRPAMYEAFHDIIPVKESKLNAPPAPTDVVGPVCESGDTFCVARQMPRYVQGDLLAICTAGAYGAVMASAYNARPIPPEVVVKGHDYAISRPRLQPATLIAMESVPGWVGKPA